MSEQTGTTTERKFESNAGGSRGVGSNGSIETDDRSATSVDAGESNGVATEPRRTERALPLDQTFEILKNQRRRYVLEYLYDADDQVSLSELAEQIAAWENDKEIRQITSSERKRVYVGLYQCHLPKMDGMDVVAFDKPRGTIDPGEHVDTFKPYLQHEAPAEDLTWNNHFVGLSILGTSLLPVALFLGMGPLLSSVAVLFVATVVGGAVWHLLRRDSASDDSGSAAQ